jgi:nickel-dependent lactate racemase
LKKIIFSLAVVLASVTVVNGSSIADGAVAKVKEKAVEATEKATEKAVDKAKEVVSEKADENASKAVEAVKSLKK